MQTEPTTNASVWPDVALDSAAVAAITRGQRIKQARLRRRESQQQVATAVGVSMRTVSRVETDQVENPSTLPLIEAYLGISDEPDAAPPEETSDRLRSVDTERHAPEPDDPNNPRIRDASVMQLLAELAGRFAASEARASNPRMPPERVRFYPEDTSAAAPEQRDRGEVR